MNAHTSTATLSEDDLEVYIATIPQNSIDQFDKTLNKLSFESGIRPGQRLGHINHDIENHTTCEVSLTHDEAIIMKLSVTGHFRVTKREQVRRALRSSK